jgi:hypothetical protein
MISVPVKALFQNDFKSAFLRRNFVGFILDSVRILADKDLEPAALHQLDEELPQLFPGSIVLHEALDAYNKGNQDAVFEIDAESYLVLTGYLCTISYCDDLPILGQQVDLNKPVANSKHKAQELGLKDYFVFSTYLKSFCANLLLNSKSSWRAEYYGYCSELNETNKELVVRLTDYALLYAEVTS